MAITVTLDDMLHARRMTLTELSEAIGITLANLSILKTGKAKAIRFSTLEAICIALDCQPGELLEFRHDEGGVDIGGADEDRHVTPSLRGRHASAHPVRTRRRARTAAAPPATA